MTGLSSERWGEVSPYLDEALALTEEERVAWLASLRKDNPALATVLQTLLDEHRALAQEGFLEQGPPLPSGQPALAGQTIGAYRLVSSIGQGGMGSVWLAERSDGRFERRVAVKFLNIALIGRGEERFKREGSILGRLAHLHIAELVDAGVSSAGQPYLVLEYVEGDHIDRYCDQRMLDVETRVRLFLDVLAAVAHAHANLIVHRDIKPSNVLVSNDCQVKLLDFGIAKLLEGEGQAGEATLLTVEGGRAMTPEYAAPEQLRGGAVTTGTDVYALGVLLYVLLTGQHPAGAGLHTPADLVKAIVDTEPPHPSDTAAPTKADTEVTASNATRRSTTPEKLRRLLRGDLDTIVAKALKKYPAERYPSVLTLAEDLQRYLRHEPIGVRPDTLAYRAGKFVRRNRTAVALATLALMTAVAGLVGTLIQARTVRVQRDFAFRQLSRVESINDLDNFLLTDAAPSGKTFTVTELLGRAEHVVERQHNPNDPNHVELLISIGRKYDSQEEDAKALRLLEEAYQLSRGLHEPSIRARASCALASTLAHGGQPVRAELFIQEGLNELPAEPQFALDRVFCLLRGREVAGHNGASQEAIARAQAAQRVLQESPVQSDPLEFGILMDLGESYRDAGRFPEAIAAFEQTSIRMTNLGRDDTEQAGTLFNNWALALYQLGRPLEAERIYRRAIDIGKASQTEEAVSPTLLNNYAVTLRELGRLDEASGYAERAYLKARQTDNQVAVNQSLLQRARIYRDLHDLARAAAMLAEVEPRLRQNLPPGHYAFASLASEKALNALAKGDLQTASRLADQSVAMDEAAIKAGGQGAAMMPTLLVRRSAIELAARQPDQAAADATRALSQLQADAQSGTFSNKMGGAYLARARALQAQGKGEEARAAALSAAEHLQSTLGSDHPDARAARQLAGLDTQPH